MKTVAVKLRRLMRPRMLSFLVGIQMLTLTPSRASLASSITNYRYENGRRYHAYREGRLMTEVERLSLEC